MSELETKDVIGEKASEGTEGEVEKAEVEVEAEKSEETKVEKAATKEDLANFYNPKQKEEVKVKEEVKPEPEVEYKEFKLDNDLEFEETFVNDIKTFSKSTRLKQEEAQKLFDFTQTAIKKDRAKIDNMIIERAKAWDEAVRVDKEIGGPNIGEKMGVIKSFVNKFGNEDVREVFRKSGLGSHPEVLRMLYKAGKAFSEDNFVPDTGVKKPVNNKNEIGETMFRFPSLEKK